MKNYSHIVVDHFITRPRTLKDTPGLFGTGWIAASKIDYPRLCCEASRLSAVNRLEFRLASVKWASLLICLARSLPLRRRSRCYLTAYSKKKGSDSTNSIAAEVTHDRAQVFEDNGSSR
jgi:hypothetical protein